MNNEVKKFYAKIGELGGSVSTSSKVEAARENGKLGGRPRKKNVSAATLATRKWRENKRREQKKRRD